MNSIDFGGWLSGAGNLRPNTQVAFRAQIQWNRILDKPTDISFKRNGVTLSPQTLRVEPEDNPSDSSSELGISTMRRTTLFGIQGHPDLDDTDVAMWDTFIFNDVEYTVLNINRTPIGQVQIYCEAVGGG